MHPSASRRFALRPSLRWGLPLAALLLTGGGALWMKSNNAAAAADKPAAEKKEDKPKVFELAAQDVAAVETRELALNLPVSGTLMPLHQATVKSKVAAELRESLLAEGQPVSRGQVVMRLDTADLQARLATFQASEEEARARLALAQKTHENNAKLFQQKYISQSALDSVQNSLELARAGLKSAESQTSIARRALEDSVVRAPIDGIIAKRYAQPGEKVPADAPLFAVVALDQLLFEAQVPTAEIPQVKVGQTVSFNVDGFGSRSFSGKVARIAPMAELGSRTMTVYIGAVNADLSLKAGMFARGGIVLEKTGALPVVPLAALRDEAGKKVVHKVENGTVVTQEVKPGLRNEAEGVVAIEQGLAAGNHVIVARLATVKPGAKVKLPGTAETPAAAKTTVAALAAPSTTVKN